MTTGKYTQLRAVLLAHMKQYPLMQPQDCVKLVYQNEFGGGHLIRDERAALSRLQEEYQNTHCTDSLIQAEEIGNGLVRVMLASLDKEQYPLERLNQDFIRSAQLHTGDMNVFLEKLSVLTDLAREGNCPFPLSELEEYLREYRWMGCPPVSHSEAYRGACKPAYRVVRKDCLLPGLPVKTPSQAVWESALELLQERSRVIVAIDGRCASGKSTLAAQLQEIYGCSVVHMDDFFLRPEQRTPQRYATPGENIDHERFLQEVLLPLERGELPSYRPFRCHTQTLGDPVQLPDRPVIVVEGSYSCHPRLRDRYDLRVFLSVPPVLQMERITARDGANYAQVFRDKWIPLEERYFSHCAVKDCCQLQFSTLG